MVSKPKHDLPTIFALRHYDSRRPKGVHRELEMTKQILKSCPTHTRMCKICGQEMIWLSLVNIWSQVYRWRAWCYEHGHATRTR